MLRRPPRVDAFPLRPGGQGCQRVEFSLRVEPGLLDAFFNGPRGYRAEFIRRGLPAAHDIDGEIIQQIVVAYRTQLEREPAALMSLHAAQAKVGIKQDRDIDDALNGRTRPVPQVMVTRWIEQMDTPALTGRGNRWLARAGVIASSGTGVLLVKGGWLRNGECVLNTGKADRTEQILNLGFA